MSRPCARGPVSDQVAGAAGHGQHAHAAAGPPRVAQQRAGDQQFLQAGHPDHVQVRQERADHRVVAGHRAGVRQRGLLAGRAGADLERHDRLARLLRGPGRPGERRRVADLLEEQADDPGVRVLGQVLQHVRGADHRLVADRGQRADPDRAGPQEAEHDAGQRAALQRDADRSRGQRQRDRQRERRGARVRVEEAQAVRAEQGDALVPGAGHQAVFQRPAFRAGLAEPGRQHDRVAHAGRARVLQHAFHRVRRRHDERQVGGLGQVAQAGHGGAAERGGVPRVDRQQRPGEADRGAAQRHEPGPARGVGGTHDRDRLRREELPEPLRGGPPRAGPLRHQAPCSPPGGGVENSRARNRRMPRSQRSRSWARRCS